MALEKQARRLLIAILRFLVHPNRVPIPPTDQIRRILVIRQHNQLGDMLCIVPLLRALRAEFPEAFIALLASPVNIEVVRNNRYIDDVINFDKQALMGRWGIGFGRMIRFITDLRRQQFDVVLVPSTVSVSFTSHLLSYLSGAHIRIGVGSIDGVVNPSQHFLTNALGLNWRNSPHRHQTLRNMDVAEPVLASTKDLSIELTLTPEEVSDGKSIYVRVISNYILSIGYHPGAGKPPNCWPAEKFAHVVNVLWKDLQAFPFITSGPMDQNTIKRLVESLRATYYLLENTPVRQVASVLANLNLVISNDTGIMHVAAAVGVPVLSLFGPTDPLQWAPIGEKHRYIVSGDGRMESISVDEVLTAAREMLRPQIM